MKLFHWTADPSSMKKQEMLHFPLNCCDSTRNVVNAEKEGKQGGKCLLLHLLGETVEGVRVDRVDLVVVQRQPGHLQSKDQLYQ